MARDQAMIDAALADLRQLQADIKSGTTTDPDLDDLSPYTPPPSWPGDVVAVVIGPTTPPKRRSRNGGQ